MKTIFSLKSVFLITIFLLCSLMAIGADSYDSIIKKEIKEFNDFLYKHNKEFEEYLKEEEINFNNYIKSIEEEMDRFTENIYDEWGDKAVNTKKIWVEYSPDLQTRKIMNFETGEMTIQIKDNKADKNKIKKEIGAFIKENASQAAKNDILANNTDKRLNQRGIKSLPYSQNQQEPILLDIVSEEPAVKDNDINKIVSDIVENGDIKEAKLPDGKNVTTFTVNFDVENQSSNKFSVLTANTNIGKIHKKAGQFKNEVLKYASIREIPEALVYAVIHNESAFNPRAVSPAPAYGLMQLVPKSGGAEAASVYFGRPVILPPSYFYDSDNNIKLGSTYLSQLYYKYFKDVKNYEARLYCTMCAYNTGPGNVARAFIGSKNLSEAIPVINRQSPKDVYNTLIRQLPYKETRTYLKNVSASYNAYYGYK